jgi:hypothetical protein
MTTRDVIRRLEAFRAGKPIPAGEKKSVYLANDRDVLVVCFVRMGGESRPWGVAFGHPGKPPRVLTVPDGRNRDLVAAMADEFAPVLLRHLHSPTDTDGVADSYESLAPLRQVWLPNRTHLDMLHLLAYAFAYAKAQRPGTDVGRLNRLGRACGWLFREAQRPGQMAVMVAPDVLKDAYAFPAENVRQAHLGYLMAWLDTPGGFDKRLAAATLAERRSVATSLDPDLERGHLAPLVSQWGDARKAGATRATMKSAGDIHKVLEPELRRRWELTVRALAWMRGDKRAVNTGVDRLVRETLKEQWYQYVRLELKRADEVDGPVYTPSVETDRHPAAAASRYFVHQAAAEFAESQLVHDDHERLADAIAAGDAFRGEIREVTDDGPGRKLRPVWRVVDRAPRQLRLRTDSKVAVVGLPERTGVIRSIEQADDALVIEVEIKNRRRQCDGPGAQTLSPVDPDLVGQEVAFVTAPADGISRRKSQLVWEEEGPGVWLTHRMPDAGIVSIPEDDVDDLSSIESPPGAAGGS